MRIFCPVGDFMCLYFTQEGFCELENPYKECDDYFAMVGEEEE